MRRGQAISRSRAATFDTFLRGVTGQRDVTPPAPAPTNQRSATPDEKTDAVRAIFEAQGVRVQSFPPELFRRLGKPPWKGRMVWSYDNITTAESDNQDQCEVARWYLSPPLINDSTKGMPDIKKKQKTWKCNPFKKKQHQYNR